MIKGITMKRGSVLLIGLVTLGNTGASIAQDVTPTEAPSPRSECGLVLATDVLGALSEAGIDLVPIADTWGWSSASGVVRLIIEGTPYASRIELGADLPFYDRESGGGWTLTDMASALTVMEVVSRAVDPQSFDRFWTTSLWPTTSATDTSTMHLERDVRFVDDVMSVSLLAEARAGQGDCEGAQ